MSNIEISEQQQNTDGQNDDIAPTYFIRQAAQALYNDENHEVNCVGVMIQAGKTLTNPANWVKTMGGGHVSPFVVQHNVLSSWDELARDENWLATVESNVLNTEAFMRKSEANDITCYLHNASQDEITAVAGRANALADPNHSHSYSHWPKLTGDSTSGDCVSMTAWVMQAFSYSKPVSGATTPWVESLNYEIYTNPLNFFSGWYKVKYSNRKLSVM